MIFLTPLIVENPLMQFFNICFLFFRAMVATSLTANGDSDLSSEGISFHTDIWWRLSYGSRRFASRPFICAFQAFLAEALKQQFAYLLRSLDFPMAP